MASVGDRRALHLRRPHRCRLYTKLGGRAFGIRIENQAEVTVFDLDRALALRSIDSPAPFEISIVLTPADDGATRIVWTEELTASGVAGLIVRATSRLHDAQTAKGLQQLKVLMESGQL